MGQAAGVGPVLDRFRWYGTGPGWSTKETVASWSFRLEGADWALNQLKALGWVDERFR